MASAAKVMLVTTIATVSPVLSKDLRRSLVRSQGQPILFRGLMPVIVTGFIRLTAVHFDDGYVGKNIVESNG